MGFSVLASYFPVTAQKPILNQKHHKLGASLSSADPLMFFGVAIPLSPAHCLCAWSLVIGAPGVVPSFVRPQPAGLALSALAAFLSQGSRDSALEAKDSRGEGAPCCPAPRQRQWVCAVVLRPGTWFPPETQCHPRVPSGTTRAPMQACHR